MGGWALSSSVRQAYRPGQTHVSHGAALETKHIITARVMATARKSIRVSGKYNQIRKAIKTKSNLSLRVHLDKWTGEWVVVWLLLCCTWCGRDDGDWLRINLRSIFGGCWPEEEDGRLQVAKQFGKLKITAHHEKEVNDEEGKSKVLAQYFYEDV